MKSERIILALMMLLSFYIGHSQKETSRDWTSFVQSVQVATNQSIKFRVTASARTEAENEFGWSGIWVRVDTKNGEPGFFDNMGDRPIISKEWNTYIVEGEINENSKSINFGGLCLNNGDFYFDKFEVLTQNANGTFEKLDIKNSGFEEDVKGNGLSSWVEGISVSNPVRIREYTYSLSKDKIDGVHALLIKGRGVKRDTSAIIGPIDGFSPQIGTLVTMLNNLSQRVERTVTGLSQNELDYVMDEKANSIGALIMHLMATEVMYQSFTFEDKYEPLEEEIDWQIAMELGDEGRKNINGHEVQYYFDLWKKVRAKTIEELKKRDDEWLAKIEPGSDANNHFAWFHVMEHQSSHLGQILLLKKRIPDFSKELDLPIKNKD